MPVVKELIRSEQDGSLSFGNYQLDTKSKVSDFEHCGDSYKVMRLQSWRRTALLYMNQCREQQ